MTFRTPALINLQLRFSIGSNFKLLQNIAGYELETYLGNQSQLPITVIIGYIGKTIYNVYSVRK
ncbi:MAG: hypothetical protein HC930_01915 [Hydrococcus sp. SU_1_0]|nr:hypothetical protein [Hydrococcus sp. SU_1_0]